MLSVYTSILLDVQLLSLKLANNIWPGWETQTQSTENVRSQRTYLTQSVS